MMKPTRTLKQITYADGTTEIAKRTGKCYTWMNGRNTSSDLDQLRFNIEARGGTISEITNTNYDYELAQYNQHKAARAKRTNPFANLFR